MLLKRNYLILLIFLLPYLAYNQNSLFFKNEKELHYKALYINSKGDTITDEKLIMKSLSKKWFVQKKLQDAVSYLYFTDTAGYKNYVSPHDYVNEKQKKHYSKKGKFKLNRKETIGTYFYKEMFYIHPPRSNQYEMLFYAWHPQIILNFLTDSLKKSDYYANSSLPERHKEYFLSSWRFLPTEKGEISKYITYLGVPAFGTFKHINTITPSHEISINNQKVKSYKIQVDSKGTLKERYQNEKKYDCKVEALFTLEFGFERILYEFQNGVKIHFYLDYLVEK